MKKLNQKIENYYSKKLVYRNLAFNEIDVKKTGFKIIAQKLIFKKLPETLLLLYLSLTTIYVIIFITQSSLGKEPLKSITLLYPILFFLFPTFIYVFLVEPRLIIFFFKKYHNGYDLSTKKYFSFDSEKLKSLQAKILCSEIDNLKKLKKSKRFFNEKSNEEFKKETITNTALFLIIITIVPIYLTRILDKVKSETIAITICITTILFLSLVVYLYKHIRKQQLQVKSEMYKRITELLNQCVSMRKANKK